MEKSKNINGSFSSHNGNIYINGELQPKIYKHNKLSIDRENKMKIIETRFCKLLNRIK